MASEITPDGRVIPPLNITNPAPILDLGGFQWGSVEESNRGPQTREDEDEQPQPAALAPSEVQPPRLPDLNQLTRQLGFADERKPLLPFPLEQFHGAYAGNGFNMIFAPASFDVSSSGVDGPNDNKLILNLTTEQWTFGPTIGEIPNRGFDKQKMINLGGLPYLQTVRDVTNTETGRGDKASDTGIHLEPGVWIFVPATNHGEAREPDSIVRMASIPHGATINAQGVVPKMRLTPKAPLHGFPGAPVPEWAEEASEKASESDSEECPKFDQLDTRPFTSSGERQDVFLSMNAVKATVKAKNGEGDTVHACNPFRHPEDLSKFVDAGTITTEIIHNPNLVLARAIENQQIRETIEFEVATDPPKPLSGGKTTNISFLGPNANATSMRNKWWIETVIYDVNVPEMRGGKTVRLRPTMPKNKAGERSTAPTPEFDITAPKEGVRKRTTIQVPGYQLQYSQTVNLEFGGLIWPHVSVATLVPTGPQPFQIYARPYC